MLQLVSPSHQPTGASSPVVRLAAAIYLKNRIRSSWRAPPSSASQDPSAAFLNSTRPASTRYVPIPPADRQTLKSNLLPLYAALSSGSESTEDDATNRKVKDQIGEALAKVVECDFPADWPGLVDEIRALLAADGQGHVEAGLRASAEVFNAMRSVSLPDMRTALFGIAART